MPITLQSLTNKLPDDRTAFIFSSGIHIRHGFLRSQVELYRAIINKSKGKKVVIYGRSRQEFALLLYLLDGTASDILFLPTDINEELYQKYIEQVQVDYAAEYSDKNGITLIAVNTNNTVANDELAETVSTNWIIPTSGTTNVPKLVAHKLDGLTRTIKSDSDLGKKFTWGLVYDIYRFAGIQVYLQALLGGSALSIPASDMSVSSMLSFFAKSKCNTISATPSFWRKALMSPSTRELKLINITLGGEIADTQVLKSLRYQFPWAKIRHIYASTEAGVGFSVNDGQAGFPVSYINSDESGVSLKIDDSGQLCIRPSKISQHYMSGMAMHNQDGYINTGDLVEIKNDRVIFLGRDSGAINVGGSKVQPEEVEQCILDTGLVSQVVVYAKNSSMLGSLVCANVVLCNLDTDKKIVKREILSQCKRSLEAYKVPAIIKFVDEIETTQSGKIKRG